MKRSIIIQEGNHEKELPLNRIVRNDRSSSEYITIQQEKDGSWTLIYTRGVIDDFAYVTDIKIKRGD